MKNFFAILLLALALNTTAQTKTAAKEVKTPIRFLLPDSLGGWNYYFTMDEKGFVPIPLGHNESAITVQTSTYNVNGYIYAKSFDNTKQTNNFAFNVKGRPLFLVVTGNNGVIVRARKMSVGKYSYLRSTIPEARRVAWN